MRNDKRMALDITILDHPEEPEHLTILRRHNETIQNKVNMDYITRTNNIISSRLYQRKDSGNKQHYYKV